MHGFIRNASGKALVGEDTKLAFCDVDLGSVLERVVPIEAVHEVAWFGGLKDLVQGSCCRCSGYRARG